MTFGDILLILTLILLNGFFVAVEFAAVASRRARLDLLTDPGGAISQQVHRWLDQPAARERLIAATQLGITVVSLALGAIMLIDLPEGGMRVDPTLAITTAVAFGGIVMFLTLLAIRSMRRTVVTGSEGLVGEAGTAVTAIDAAGGKVQVHGEYWNARSDAPVAAGTPVRVRKVDGLTLWVEPAGDAPGPLDRIDT